MQPKRTVKCDSRFGDQFVTARDLTIAKVEARNKTQAPWRTADPACPAQDAGVPSRLRALLARMLKKDFLPCANKPTRHTVLHCAVPAHRPRPQVPWVRPCA